ncbi:syntaxin-61 [Trifolium pratense]|uniref:Syntaxin-61 n=1 Tax=Trifolium pratense TaxID=57577 RepID=A0A2K3P0M8_TRIPR|nr:syntaxin-61 [Trifolium pratense]
MASSFDRWEKDPFFNAAEEVQESADRMESTYRTWLHATKDSSSMWNPNELRRDLLTTLGTAKWQLEEFEREVKSSYSKNLGNDARRTRHQDFITAIDEKIKKVEHSLNESSPSDGKESKPWVCLDEEEKDELAFFLSGMPLAAESNNPKLCDKNSVSPGVGEEKEVSRGIRRVASASADISSWKISVSDDPQQLSSSSGSSGAMHKVPSLSGFFSSVESISKLKWPKNGYGYRKLKTVEHHKETDSAQIPMAELNRVSS